MDLTIKPHTIWQSIGLHLTPGVLITLFVYLATPYLQAAGFPPLMGIMMAILFVLIPLELGVLLYEGKKASGRFSITSVIGKQEPLVWWQFALIVIGLIVWCAIFFLSLSTMDGYLAKTYFTWLPASFNFSLTPVIAAQYSPAGVKTTIIAGFLLNGLAGPIVEELYFRGYLLPRFPASRTWAPLFNVMLFSLYHFFSPWQNITRIIVLLPMVYAVSWKRNIYLGMVTHCTGNILGMIGLLSLLAH
jgi:uncharacterized protein